MPITALLSPVATRPLFPFSPINPAIYNWNLRGYRKSTVPTHCNKCNKCNNWSLSPLHKPIHSFCGFGKTHCNKCNKCNNFLHLHQSSNIAGKSRYPRKNCNIVILAPSSGSTSQFTNVTVPKIVTNCNIQKEKQELQYTHPDSCPLSLYNLDHHTDIR